MHKGPLRFGKSEFRLEGIFLPYTKQFHLNVINDCDCIVSSILPPVISSFSQPYNGIPFNNPQLLNRFNIIFKTVKQFMSIVVHNVKTIKNASINLILNKRIKKLLPHIQYTTQIYNTNPTQIWIKEKKTNCPIKKSIIPILYILHIVYLCYEICGPMTFVILHIVSVSPCTWTKPNCGFWIITNKKCYNPNYSSECVCVCVF